MQVIKFDVETKLKVEWSAENCLPMEPVFVPRPDAIEEDDGELFKRIFYLTILSSRNKAAIKSST